MPGFVGKPREIVLDDGAAFALAGVAEAVAALETLDPEEIGAGDVLLDHSGSAAGGEAGEDLVRCADGSEGGVGTQSKRLPVFMAVPFISGRQGTRKMRI